MNTYNKQLYWKLPSVTTLAIGTLASCAMNPSVTNITIPANQLVRTSTTGIIMASL